MRIQAVVAIGVGMAALALSPLAWAEDVQLVCSEKSAEQSVAVLILSGIYQKAGITLQIQPVPAARATAMALAGEVDGEVARIAAYANNNPRLIKVEPSFYYLTSTAFARADRNITIQSKEDLKKYRVGIVRGIAHAKVATEGVSAVDEVATYPQMFQMLEAGRIDVAIDTDINGAYLIKKMELADVKAVGNLARLPLFHILTSRAGGFAPKIAATLKSLKGSGELDKMSTRAEEAFLKSGAEP